MPGEFVYANGPLKRLSLRAVFLLSAAGYVLFALWFPLVPNVDLAPAADIRAFAPSIAAGLLYAVLIVGLFMLMIAAFRRAEAGYAARYTLRVVLITSLALALPLLLAYPINATDIFGYVIRGRIASAYGDNPFVSPAAEFIGDPFMPLVGEWVGLTTPYGPVWETVAAGLTAVSGDSLLWGVLLFKGLALACFLITTALIWGLLPENPRRLPLALLWAWNPGLLLTFILNGHNDSLMLMWLVLGFAVACRGRKSAGFVIMVLAALTKPVALLALPFFFIGFWREVPAGRPRFRFAALALAGSLAAVGLAFLPWAAQDGFLRTTLNLAQRLMEEAAGGAGYSPAVWLFILFDGRVDIEPIGAVLQAIFAGVALWLVWMTARGRPALRGVADIFFAYLTTALNFRVWYTVWPFPWLLLDAGRLAGTAGAVESMRVEYRLRVGLWFLLMAQLSVVVYGHLRVFALAGDQTYAHLIGVLLVFVLPWVLAALPARLSQGVHFA